MRNGTKNGGFTLIEVLLALGLSAVILGAIYSLLYVGAKGGVRLRQRTDMDQTARVVLDRLENDLENAVPLSKGQWEKKFSFQGDSATLSFPAMLSVVDPEAKQPPFERSVIGLITYRWRSSGAGMTNVLEREWVLLTPDPALSVPIAGKEIYPAALSQLSFFYAYWGEPVSWDVLWREPNRIPQGVRVDLTLEAPNDSRPVVLSKTIRIWHGVLGNAKWLTHAAS